MQRPTAGDGRHNGDDDFSYERDGVDDDSEDRFESEDDEDWQDRSTQHDDHRRHWRRRHE